MFIDNVVDGNMAMTYPETLPYVCNMCQLPILGTPGKGWNVKDYPLEYNGRLYHFGSGGRPLGLRAGPGALRRPPVHRRPLPGRDDPADGPRRRRCNTWAWRPGEIGDDAHNYAWAEV